MPAERIHLIRHGEVHNPDGVLYGRLPHFSLSTKGHDMAALAAAELKATRRPVSALYASPLLRTRESAEHIEEAFGLNLQTDERLIEPHNVFEGRRLSAGRILVRPHLYFHLRNPYRPSWGEDYVHVAGRMLAAITDAWEKTPDGDVVLVSHQLPIVMVQRALAGETLAHNPKKRRCALSSITTLERQGNRFVEVDYRDPAAGLGAKDLGAV